MILATMALGFVALFGQDDQVPVEKPVRPELFEKPSYGPRLSKITMAVQISSKSGPASGTVTMPVPGDYNGQALLGLRVQAYPPSALASWQVFRRPDGLNDVLKARVGAGLERVTLSYTAIVAAPGYGIARTQKREYARWMAPSSRVQSHDPEIAGIAASLRKGTSDNSDYVGRAVRWVASHKLRPGITSHASDAGGALADGGDSLGRAALCAALLRAGGIPARIVACAPTWGAGSDAEQWMTEYRSEDNWWQMLDPTVGIQYPVRNTYVVLSIASLADESSASDDALPFRPDAPRLSTPEISKALAWSAETPSEFTTSLLLIRTFPWQTGGRLMMSAMKRHTKVIESAKVGRDDWMDEALIRRLIGRGPINLALYLDGQPTLPGR